MAPVVATAAGERALGLARRTRLGVQRRLGLIGFDTGGVDGIFGPGTRAAIRAWQATARIEATGYLDAGALAALTAETEAPYRAWRAAVSAERRAAETRRIAEAAEGLLEEPAANGCARAADGSIVARQSLICDIAGMGEGVAGLVEALGTL